MPDAEAVLASLAWHFLVGAGALTGDQLAEHETREACPACEGKPLPVLEDASTAEACRG
jgi:formate dehydrogenase maturation protein FdhE